MYLQCSECGEWSDTADRKHFGSCSRQPKPITKTTRIPRQRIFDLYQTIAEVRASK